MNQQKPLARQFFPVHNLTNNAEELSRQLSQSEQNPGSHSHHGDVSVLSHQADPSIVNYPQMKRTEAPNKQLFMVVAPPVQSEQADYLQQDPEISEIDGTEEDPLTLEKKFIQLQKSENMVLSFETIQLIQTTIHCDNNHPKQITYLCLEDRSPFRFLCDQCLIDNPLIIKLHHEKLFNIRAGCMMLQLFQKAQKDHILRQEQESMLQKIKEQNSRFDFRKHSILGSPSKHTQERYSTNQPSKKNNRSLMVRKLQSMKQRNEEVKQKVQESIISPLAACKEFFQQFRQNVNQKINGFENSWIAQVESSVGQLFDEVNQTDDLEERLSLITDGIKMEKGLNDYLQRCLETFPQFSQTFPAEQMSEKEVLGTEDPAKAISVLSQTEQNSVLGLRLPSIEDLTSEKTMSHFHLYDFGDRTSVHSALQKLTETISNQEISQLQSTKEFLENGVAGFIPKESPSTDHTSNPQPSPGKWALDELTLKKVQELVDRQLVFDKLKLLIDDKHIEKGFKDFEAGLCSMEQQCKIMLKDLLVDIQLKFRSSINSQMFELAQFVQSQNTSNNNYTLLKQENLFEEIMLKNGWFLEASKSNELRNLHGSFQKMVEKFRGPQLRDTQEPQSKSRASLLDELEADLFQFPQQEERSQKSKKLSVGSVKTASIRSKGQLSSLMLAEKISPLTYRQSFAATSEHQAEEQATEVANNDDESINQTQPIRINHSIMDFQEDQVNQQSKVIEQNQVPPNSMFSLQNRINFMRHATITNLVNSNGLKKPQGVLRAPELFRMQQPYQLTSQQWTSATVIPSYTETLELVPLHRPQQQNQQQLRYNIQELIKKKRRKQYSAAMPNAHQGQQMESYQMKISSEKPVLNYSDTLNYSRGFQQTAANRIKPPLFNASPNHRESPNQFNLLDRLSSSPSHIQGSPNFRRQGQIPNYITQQENFPQSRFYLEHSQEEDCNYKMLDEKRSQLQDKISNDVFNKQREQQKQTANKPDIVMLQIEKMLRKRKKIEERMTKGYNTIQASKNKPKKSKRKRNKKLADSVDLNQANQNIVEAQDDQQDDPHFQAAVARAKKLFEDQVQLEQIISGAKKFQTSLLKNQILFSFFVCRFSQKLQKLRKNGSVIQKPV